MIDEPMAIMASIAKLSKKVKLTSHLSSLAWLPHRVATHDDLGIDCKA